MNYDQCKTCRRLGQKLFLKGARCLSGKCAFTRNSNAPGLVKKRKGGAMSDYKKSLQEKQALKKWYGLSEKQFKAYVQKALKKMGKVENISAELILELEKRFDNVIFRSGFAESRPGARQMVSHGQFIVNGKPVNIPSYNVKKGDVISVKESKKKKPIFRDMIDVLRKKEAPVWLTLNKEKMEVKVIGDPDLLEVNPPAEISLIFEFYSR
jgi:small subunit ribosomal protein S4